MYRVCMQLMQTQAKMSTIVQWLPSLFAALDYQLNCRLFNHLQHILLDFFFFNMVVLQCLRQQNFEHNSPCLYWVAAFVRNAVCLHLCFFMLQTWVPPGIVKASRLRRSHAGGKSFIMVLSTLLYYNQAQCVFVEYFLLLLFYSQPLSFC